MSSGELGSRGTLVGSNESFEVVLVDELRPAVSLVSVNWTRFLAGPLRRDFVCLLLLDWRVVVRVSGVVGVGVVVFVVVGLVGEVVVVVDLRLPSPPGSRSGLRVALRRFTM